VLLFAFSPLLPGQTKTVINARGEERAAPWHAQGAGWSVGVDRDVLQALINIEDQKLTAGSVVDYELTVTNTGSEAVNVPRSLEWKDVDSGSSEQRYTEAKVVFELGTKESFTNLTPTLNFYSVKEKPSTQLVLYPGDSIRILGTLSVQAREFSPKWTGKATLTAHLCVSSIHLTSVPGPGKRNEIAKQMLWCVTADPKYEVSLPEH
jgi:hypothetical protein